MKKRQKAFTKMSTFVVLCSPLLLARSLEDFLFTLHFPFIIIMEEICKRGSLRSLSNFGKSCHITKVTQGSQRIVTDKYLWWDNQLRTKYIIYTILRKHNHCIL